MTGEQLFVPPPKGWKVGIHDRRRQSRGDRTGAGRSDGSDWSEMLTVQFISGKPDQQPQEMLKEQMQEIEESCEDIGAGQINLSGENGYDTALRAVACTKSKQWGKGELSLHKVFRAAAKGCTSWRDHGAASLSKRTICRSGPKRPTNGLPSCGMSCCATVGTPSIPCPVANAQPVRRSDKPPR